LKKVGLVVKAADDARKKADEFEIWLQSESVAVVRKENLQINRHIPLAPADLFCVFVLGGDGTFLSAARWIGDRDIPVLGVKFGEVGFLAETTEEELFHAADSVLNERFETFDRMRLLVNIIRDKQDIICETVLNDVVINKGALARLARIDSYIDDEYLTTYRADGLIIATPTGSTAYSLAAGGPILHPAVPGILMTPICPFTLTNRPLIVPDSACIALRLAEKSSHIMLTFDGQTGFHITEKDTIFVRKSLHPLKMIVMPGRRYYDVLKTKLRWSGGRM